MIVPTVLTPPRLGPRWWRAGRHTIDVSRPVLIGILNVTPDSFSDGGLFLDVRRAVAHAETLVAAGADIIDVGGESTRPGANDVPLNEEIRRVIPVIGELRARFPDLPLSIDTLHAKVAAAALLVGADIVNDVSGFRNDPTLPALCAERGCGVILMHSRGTLEQMARYELAEYGEDVAGEVMRELDGAIAVALGAGVTDEQIVIDPGIGFAKRSEHSQAILLELPRIADMGYPVLLGVSRKRIVGLLSGVTNAGERDVATAGVNVWGLLGGARLFRVHDVATNRQAIDTVFNLWHGQAQQASA